MEVIKGNIPRSLWRCLGSCSCRLGVSFVVDMEGLWEVESLDEDDRSMLRMLMK